MYISIFASSLHTDGMAKLGGVFIGVICIDVCKLLFILVCSYLFVYSYSFVSVYLFICLCIYQYLHHRYILMGWLNLVVCSAWSV